MILKSKKKNADLCVYSASLSYLLEYKGLLLSLISSPSRSSSIRSVVESESVLLRSFSILLLAQILDSHLMHENSFHALNLIHDTKYYFVSHLKLG